MPHSPNEPGRPFFPSMRTSSKNKPERPSRPTTQAPRSAVKLGSPDHECAMLPPCRRRGSTYRNRNPKPKSKAPGKGGFVGVVVQLGLRWGASVPTRTRERRLVTEIKIFVICLTKIVSGAPASTLQKPNFRLPNHPRKPKSRAPGKGRSVGAVGQLGLRWGASVPARTRERRLVTEIKIFVICLTKIVSGAPASTLQKPPPQAQIEGTGQRGVRGCRGAAGDALGCFGSDPNARAAFGYWNQNFRYLPYENRQRRACFNATETEFPAPKPPPCAKPDGETTAGWPHGRLFTHARSGACQGRSDNVRGSELGLRKG